jgi:hypothetical protein
MTNLELIELLTQMPKDSEVRICIKLPFATVGPVPTRALTSVSSGFDWEHGKILLQAEVDLCPFEYCNKVGEKL